MNSSARLDYRKASPGVAQAMMALERHVAASAIEKPLYELVKVRASQINGCAYCLDMHTKDARAAGETEQRLYAVSVWRETPFFTPRERAALAWTEALTTVADTQHVPDALFEESRAHFDEAELVDLTLGVIAINGWNRIAIAFALPVGNYAAAVKATA